MEDNGDVWLSQQVHNDRPTVSRWLSSSYERRETRVRSLSDILQYGIFFSPGKPY